MVPSSDLSCSSSLLGSALENYGKVLADHMAEKDKNVESHNELLFYSVTLSYLSKKEFSLTTMMCHLESDAELRHEMVV